MIKEYTDMVGDFVNQVDPPTKFPKRGGLTGPSF